MTQLNPCPYCNKKAVYLSALHGNVFVSCDAIDCVTGPIEKSELSAARTWNQFTQSTEPKFVQLSRGKEDSVLALDENGGVWAARDSGWNQLSEFRVPIGN